MANSQPFWAVVRQGVRPHAVAQAIDFGVYLILWSTVLGAHIVRVVASKIGIEPDIVKYVALMEKWVFLATFAAFFWRVLTRVYAGLKEGGFTDDKS